jgi:hypothetical protein
MSMECRALPVGDLLGGNAVYQMPPFQRAFSWGAEEAVQLFDDIRAAHTDNIHNPNSSGQYFIGQLIVSKARMAAPLDVIDGQQRLATLSIIIAILRDLIPDDRVKSDLQTNLTRPHNVAQHLIERPRVKIRLGDQDSYERWIVEPEGTIKPNRMPASPATEKISDSIARIQEEIGSPHVEQLHGLVSFLLNNCFVVLTIAENPDDAFKLFRSINARGQPLTELDIIRGEFLNPFSQNRAKSIRLADAWGEIQEQLGDGELEKYIISVVGLIQPYNPRQSLKDTLQIILAHPAMDRCS